MRRYVLVAVCIGLVLLCTGLFLTFVNKVRETTARMVCTCHLKCLALAHYNYADHHGALPAGTVPNTDLLPEQRLSWCVSVLPHIEQDTVFKQFDLERGPGDSRNENAASNRFPSLVCPSSGEYDRDTRQWKSPTPLTHYVGVAGVGADAAELPLGHPRAGIFGHDRRTALADITDGTSNTLLLIETANSPGHWAFGGTATVRAFAGEPAYIGPGRPFGGFHNGGVVLVGERYYACTVALADGAVRTITNKAAPEVLEALATVAGKEEVTPNW